MYKIPIFLPNKHYSLEKDDNTFFIKTREYFDDAGNQAYELELSYKPYNSYMSDWCKYYYYIKYKLTTLSSYSREDLIINSYGYYNEKVALNSGHEVVDIICPVKGFRIGSIILNQLILWAIKKYPNIPFKNLRLSYVDEKDEENKIRRNSLYINLGFEISGDIALGKLAKDMTPRNINFSFLISEILE